MPHKLEKCIENVTDVEVRSGISEAIDNICLNPISQKGDIVITGSVKYFTLKHSGHVFPENIV